ncbi:helix-turn-helix domain-containing protein [Staphylococcus equorum]|uniref:helix-turn-helix domain-containing protein n=1 Tax=Staphylococcus equorum TaxID=246432 RepID=UPI002407C0E1|nr:helix-turn-helix transcriptional regulator [Staphylococcus equorum]MDG0843120.1 helix-turn-helix domain-containing protein [Staphylococcus equorum]
MRERSQFVEDKIKVMGYNTRSFANEVGVSYTTLRSMLERNFEGAKIENVIAVAKGINVSVEYLFDIGTDFEEVEAAHSDKGLTEKEVNALRDILKNYED